MFPEAPVILAHILLKALQAVDRGFSLTERPQGLHCLSFDVPVCTLKLHAVLVFWCCGPVCTSMIIRELKLRNELSGSELVHETGVSA